MPRKQKQPASTPTFDLPQDFLEKLIPGLMITTEAMVAELPKKDEPAMPGGGGMTSKPGLVPGFVLYGHPGGSVLSRIASARTWRGAAGSKANTNPCACPTAPVATTASRNPQPSAPSWRTSRSTVRGKKRTTGLQRAHRRRKEAA